MLCEDYRKLEGSFDKLVSVEMIEAVGHDFYSSYFSRCSQLLKPNGKMVIQAITIADQRYEAARKSVDFIQRYIFPGGSLPSVAVIADHLARDTDMQMVHLRDITRRLRPHPGSLAGALPGGPGRCPRSWGSTRRSSACGSSTSPTARAVSASASSARCNWPSPSPATASTTARTAPGPGPVAPPGR